MFSGGIKEISGMKWVDKSVLIFQECSPKNSWWFCIHFLEIDLAVTILKRNPGENSWNRAKKLSKFRQFDPPCGFFKNVFFRESVKPVFFVTFDIILSHIFPKNFIEIIQVVQKIWRFSPWILTFSLTFLIFWHFSAAKKLRTPAYNKWFLYFQPTQNKLFNNCMKLCRYQISSLRYEEGGTTSKKAQPYKGSMIRVNTCFCGTLGCMTKIWFLEGRWALNSVDTFFQISLIFPNISRS